MEVLHRILDRIILWNARELLEMVVQLNDVFFGKEHRKASVFTEALTVAAAGAKVTTESVERQDGRIPRLC